MEVLSPAGSKETFMASLNAGADAIYVGGKDFSARAYADNFSLEEMDECIKIAHVLNVKVYVAVNTLIFEDELEKCFQMCEKYIDIGVDAFIVQDLGLVSLLRRAYPDFPLHASTQMNVHSLLQAQALQKLGFKRVVLSRECSLKTIKEIINKTHLEVEVFVHGALCVSQSGQCYMSSFIGNRSGNRGRCAQPCRMNGRIVSENYESDTIFPLSTKDLCTIDKIDELAKIGVTSFKIEGRMKNKEYVFLTTYYYKKKIMNEKFDLEIALKQLKLCFNRQFSKGFIFEESPLKILNQKSCSTQGIKLGKVVKVTDKSLFIKLFENLNLHDGLRIDNSYSEGFLLTHFKLNGKDIHHASKGQTIEIIERVKHIKINDIVLKTRSKENELFVENSLKQNRKIDIKGYFTSTFEGMTYTLYDDKDSFTAAINISMEKSVNSFTSREDLINRLSKTDKYPFKITNIDFDIIPGLFYQISQLNNLRRNALQGLLDLKLSFKKKYVKHEIVKYNLTENNNKAPLIVCQNEEQLLKCLNRPFEKVFVENYDLYEKYKEYNVSYLRKRYMDNYPISKEFMTSNLVLNTKYMSSYGNVTNSEAVALLYNLGFSHIVLSYEVSFQNALKTKKSFINKYGFDPKLYYPLYGYIEYMLLKSCPIGTIHNNKDIHCSLCHQNEYYYEDRMKTKYRLIGNEDCTLKVYSDKPLNLFDYKNLIMQDFIPFYSLSFENNYLADEILNCIFSNNNLDDLSFKGHFEKSPD